MQLHRYESVRSADVGRINQLLVRGWQPVREIITGGEPGEAIVLLERESDFPQFAGAMLEGGIPVDVLRDVPLFDGLSMDELREILGLGQVLVYSEGDVIFAAGEEPSGISVILDGMVSLQMLDLPEHDSDVTTLGVGAVVGESTFFAPAPHTISAVSASDSVSLLAFGREGLEAMLQAGQPAVMKLAVNCARILAERLQGTDRWVHDLLQGEQDSRVAASWRRFRHRIHGGSQPTGGFFGV